MISLSPPPPLVPVHLALSLSFSLSLGDFFSLWWKASERKDLGLPLPLEL